MPNFDSIAQQGRIERERMKASQNRPLIPFKQYVEFLKVRREAIALANKWTIHECAWTLFIEHLRKERTDANGMYTGLQEPSVDVDNFAVNGDVVLRSEAWNEDGILSQEFRNWDGDWDSYCSFNLGGTIAAYNDECAVLSFGD